MDKILKAIAELQFSDLEQIFSVNLVDGKIVFTEIVNQAYRPNFKAVIEFGEMVKTIHSKGFLFLAHTHPEGGFEFSESDKVFADAWDIPVIVICPKTKNYNSYFPSEFTAENFELLNREYILGVFDCYTLARDFYFKEFGVSLKRIDRRLDWSLEEIGEECLEKIEDFAWLKYGDILVFGKNDKFLHCGVYAGNNKIIHQNLAKKSCIDDITGNLMSTFIRAYRLKND